MKFNLKLIECGMEAEKQNLGIAALRLSVALGNSSKTQKYTSEKFV